VPFHLFPFDSTGQDEIVGKILKKPKSLAVEVMTTAETFVSLSCYLPLVYLRARWRKMSV